MLNCPDRRQACEQQFMAADHILMILPACLKMQAEIG
jgi:hypothetical protein